MPEAPRWKALIEWDFGARGLWTDTLTESSGETPDLRSLLSLDLLDDLHEWNREGEYLFGSVTPEDFNHKLPKFYEAAEKLARRARSQLGPEWQVTYENGVGIQVI